MLNFRGGGLTVERLMYFTDWAPGVHFLEKKSLSFFLRNPCNEKGKSISYLVHARQRLQEPVFLSLAWHAATPFASLPWIWGSEDVVWVQPSPNPPAQCPCGVTQGPRGVLVIALGVRRGVRGPEHHVSYESPGSKLAGRCPPCRAGCHGHPVVTHWGPLTQSQAILTPAGSAPAPQPGQAAMSSVG